MRPRRPIRLVATSALLAVVGLVSAPSAASARAPEQCSSGPAYAVADGDSWFEIAQRADVAVDVLLAQNDATPTTPLHPGDRVCLPSGTAQPASTSASGSTAVTSTSAPARRTSCASTRAAYTVVAGDSWFAIAHRARVPLDTLLDANDADPSRPLQPGDPVCVPSAAAALTSSAVSGPSSVGPASSTSSTVTAERSCRSAEAKRPVATGDSWFAISHKEGVTIDALLEANDAETDTSLHPGSIVCVPAPTPASTRDSSPERARQVVATRSGLIRAAPLQGPCDYADTWRAPRGGGRRHEGVDFMAGAGRYVYAVTDGTLSARAWDRPGTRAGNAWWLTSADGSGTYFFYAHLSAFAPGLKVGSTVRAGQIIGFVGETGNAAGPHLHFEVHPGGGGAIDPYPTVHALGGCNDGPGYTQPGGWTPAHE